MGKASKILSAFLVAVIVLSAGGFFASYRHGKKQAVQTTQTTAEVVTNSPKQIETTGETVVSNKISSEISSEKETTKSISTTAKAVTQPESTSTGTTVKTGYPYNYAGINPAMTNITDDNWNMVLINADNYLPESYNFKLAVAAYAPDGSPVKLDESAAVYYKKMYTAAEEDGLKLTPTSSRGGYRTPATQQGLFEDKIKRYGKPNDAAAVKQAARINQPPGCSEHNAGLAMDIGTTTDFEKTKTYQWLSENAADYGFIMRYPASKSAITGVMYEPWHWRFVGLEHAPKIKASGLCFEEYLETL